MTAGADLEGRLIVRRRVVATGVVQGVGFRPFAFRLAAALGLAGLVGNDAAGAFVEIEGPGADVERFLERLVEEAPPLARIDALRVSPLAVRGGAGFAIVESVRSAPARTLVPPDVATCLRCLAEAADPGDRRFRYPFISCTDCGPRFTIIRALPYDRPQTTMAGFALCPACATEYDDPSDRRYHAQPTACPACGPRLRFDTFGRSVTGTDAALGAVQRAWAAGAVVAVKGDGGFHLTCDAASEEAVGLLRLRKGREDKPFAVMVRDIAAARSLALLEPAEEDVLRSSARPILLARRRLDAAVAAAVAPGTPRIGIMLAGSALQQLLLSPVPDGGGEPPRVIVATSGNRSSEPICIAEEEAQARLGAIADAFLTHDRPIQTACDDSVVRVEAGVERPVRRSRGYAPAPVRLPVPLAPTLAVGGELKNAFCLAAGERAWLSQHIGDMASLETLAAFERSVAQFEAMYGIAPAVVACDRHPGYLTRRWAREHRGGAELVEVQHHHAHVASLMAEHGLAADAAVIGIVFDGSGYGDAVAGGPAIWGGELLVAGYAGFRRAGHLAELPLPGGDAAVRNPYRVALAYLDACGVPLADTLAPVRATEPQEQRTIARQLQTGTGIVPTTSVGRLFDAVASLLDVRHRVSYEAQAAIELEALADAAEDAWPLELVCGSDGVLDPAPLLAGLIDALARGVEPARLALGFHAALASGAAAAAGRVSVETGLTTVGLTGGVFQNALLSRVCRSALEAIGLDVLEHQVVPSNDGGLALGQAVIAGRLDRHER